MTERVGPMLPAGRIEHAEVTDSPALLAERRPGVQQTVLEGRTADAHPVTMIVREFDPAAGRARSVPWQVEGLPLAPGWTALRDANGSSLDAAEQEVDGHLVQVSAAAVLQGAEVADVIGDVATAAT